ncbi:MAG: bifunctional transaldolase/phosoglucose isomerase [Chloroflexi bacterium]|nr:bifunctional transaldolase/phosoglucose isomerase [Chloroflexota bacterium]
MTTLHTTQNFGQSIWLDNIRRALLTRGGLAGLIEKGVTGVTSNPTIFEKAIVGSADYDKAMIPLVQAGKSPTEIYETLAFEDISRAADLLRPIYDRTNYRDGFISLEVNPALANDTAGTLTEARRLFKILSRPNVMIKVPATPAGISAIEALISEGINVNVTLIFSIEQYREVALAYLAGLEKFAQAGGDPSRVSSVASFFVSRVDAALDPILAGQGHTELQGKIAIANARAAYGLFTELFSGERWQKLQELGAYAQRPLWASTGTKNPLYSNTLYLDNLIGADTVNTVPPETLIAFLDHGRVEETLVSGLTQAQADLKQLSAFGLDLKAVTDKLLDDAVLAFSRSFETLMASIAQKQKDILAQKSLLAFSLGGYKPSVDGSLLQVREERVMSRIWEGDHTVWKSDPTEIANRLGWLDSPAIMCENITQLNTFLESVKADGIEQALLMGMGGSSLAPEVFSKIFADPNKGLKKGLSVLDSTDPQAILAMEKSLDLTKTLFIVSTKSGGTVETFSFFKYFYNRVAERIGNENASKHFIAITDPDSGLADVAAKYNFRAVFLNDPNIGGRYSALTMFGLVPAALVGVDVERLLDSAQVMTCNNDGCNSPVDGNNLGGQLGTTIGELAKQGRDKLTFIRSPKIEPFGDWVEQLIAESTGKEGKGILPVVGEPVGKPEVYGNDRVFVYIKLADDSTYDESVGKLEKSGHPIIRLFIDNVYDLGGQFFLWEMATAVAGARLGINPFDQPNVEAAKILARKMVAEFTEKGALPKAESAPLSATTLKAFLDGAKSGAYITIQAYIQPTAESDRALLDLRTRLRDETKLATTFGYGPRFLHSTGQLHKGDAGKGLFIQFTSQYTDDVVIPDEAGKSAWTLSFGALKTAQALGDAQALRDGGRAVIHFDLGADAVAGLKKL